MPGRAFVTVAEPQCAWGAARVALNDSLVMVYSGIPNHSRRIVSSFSLENLATRAASCLALFASASGLIGRGILASTGAWR